jgi:hypothetical protein
MRAFFTSFVNQVKVKKKDWLNYAGVILGLFVFGVVLAQVIMHMDVVESEDDLFCLGTCIDLVALGTMMTFLMAIPEVSGFNYGISLGCTRKSYWPAAALRLFVMYVLLQMEIMLLQYLEGRILKLTWPAYFTEDLAHLLDWSFVLPLALTGTGLNLLLAASMIKFGKIAYFFWYILFVAACIGIPRLIDRLDPRILDAFVDALTGHAAQTFLLFGAVVAIVCYVVSYLMIRRQQVNV